MAGSGTGIIVELTDNEGYGVRATNVQTEGNNQGANATLFLLSIASEGEAKMIETKAVMTEARAVEAGDVVPDGVLETSPGGLGIKNADGTYTTAYDDDDGSSIAYNSLFTQEAVFFVTDLDTLGQITTNDDGEILATVQVQDANGDDIPDLRKSETVSSEIVEIPVITLSPYTAGEGVMKILATHTNAGSRSIEKLSTSITATKMYRNEHGSERLVSMDITDVKDNSTMNSLKTDEYLVVGEMKANEVYGYSETAEFYVKMTAMNDAGVLTLGTKLNNMTGVTEKFRNTPEPPRVVSITTDIVNQRLKAVLNFYDADLHGDEPETEVNLTVGDYILLWGKASDVSSYVTNLNPAANANDDFSTSNLYSESITKSSQTTNIEHYIPYSTISTSEDMAWVVLKAAKAATETSAETVASVSSAAEQTVYKYEYSPTISFLEAQNDYATGDTFFNFKVVGLTPDDEDGNAKAENVRISFKIGEVDGEKIVVGLAGATQLNEYGNVVKEDGAVSGTISGSFLVDYADLSTTSLIGRIELDNLNEPDNLFVSEAVEGIFAVKKIDLSQVNLTLTNSTSTDTLPTVGMDATPPAPAWDLDSAKIEFWGGYNQNLYDLNDDTVTDPWGGYRSLLHTATLNLEDANVYDSNTSSLKAQSIQVPSSSFSATPGKWIAVILKVDAKINVPNSASTTMYGHMTNDTEISSVESTQSDGLVHSNPFVVANNGFTMSVKTDENGESFNQLLTRVNTQGALFSNTNDDFQCFYFPEDKVNGSVKFAIANTAVNPVNNDVDDFVPEQGKFEFEFALSLGYENLHSFSDQGPSIITVLRPTDALPAVDAAALPEAEHSPTIADIVV